jgi:hypothetical protein
MCHSIVHKKMAHLPNEIWATGILPQCNDMLALYALACVDRQLRALVDVHVRSIYRPLFDAAFPEWHLMRYLVEHGTLFQLLFWGPTTLDRKNPERLPAPWTVSLLAHPSVALLEWLGPVLVRQSMGMIQDGGVVEETALGALVRWCRDTTHSDAETGATLQWLFEHDDCWPANTFLPHYDMPVVPALLTSIGQLWRRNRTGVGSWQQRAEEMAAFLVQCGRVSLLCSLPMATEGLALLNKTTGDMGALVKLAVASNSVAMLQNVLHLLPVVAVLVDHEDLLVAVCYKNRAMLDLLVAYDDDTNETNDMEIVPTVQVLDALHTANALAFAADYLGWADDPHTFLLNVFHHALRVDMVWTERRRILQWLVVDSGLLTPERLRAVLWDPLMHMAFGALLTRDAGQTHHFTQDALDHKFNTCECPAHTTLRMLRDHFGFADLRVTMDDVNRVVAAHAQRHVYIMEYVD